MSPELRDAETVVRSACSAVATPQDSDPPFLRNARALGSIVGKFFVATSTESFPKLSFPLKTRDEYAREIIALEGVMVTFRRGVAAIDHGRNDSVTRSRLRHSTARVVQQMDRVIATYRDIVSDSCERAVRTRARDIAKDAEDGLAGYDRGYGEEHEGSPLPHGEAAGSAALGEFFSGHADHERKLADQLRLWVVAVLLVIALLALWILFTSPLNSDTLGRELARLSVTVPLAVLAGYLGKESSRHRNTAERSGELGVHFSNLDSYTADLSEEERRRYRYELGRRAYLVEKQSTADTSSPGLVEELARLVEAIRGAFR